MNRFEKQTILPGFSEKEQVKLADAKILIVGAGGLGCPALLYLAAAGVGNLAIADGDRVAVTNLNRQILYGESDTGHLKANVAALYLNNKYSDIKLETYPQHLTAQNALDIIVKYDIVLDCTDNFSSRYLISDACTLLKKPLVSGALFQHEGQIMAFDPKHKVHLHYRHVHPVPPLPDEIPDCNSTGVLGVLSGMIGIMMATEGIKLITGFGISLVNKIMLINIRDNTRFEVNITMNPEADLLLPNSEDAFRNCDYSFICPNTETACWTDVKKTPNSLLVDVREVYELPKLQEPIISFPLSAILKGEKRILGSDILYVFCQTENRSEKAVRLLKEQFPDKKIYMVKGGVESYEHPFNTTIHEKA